MEYLQFITGLMNTKIPTNKEISSEQLLSIAENYFNNWAKKTNIKKASQIKELSYQIQNVLNGYEQRNSIDLDILNSRSLYYCPNCNSLIPIEKFRTNKCSCGRNIDNVTKANCRVHDVLS